MSDLVTSALLARSGLWGGVDPVVDPLARSAVVANTLRRSALLGSTLGTGLYGSAYAGAYGYPYGAYGCYPYGAYGYGAGLGYGGLYGSRLGYGGLYGSRLGYGGLGVSALGLGVSGLGYGGLYNSTSAALARSAALRSSRLLAGGLYGSRLVNPAPKETDDNDDN